MAGTPAAQVQVVGMKALRRDIKRLATDQSSQLYQGIKEAGKQAAEPVAARARSTLPHDSGTLSGNVRTSGTRTGGAVRMGQKSVPYAGWVEFGGRRPDGSARPFVASGRYLFPAAAGLAATSAELYAAAIDRVLNDPAVWTNTTTDGSSVHD
jgi:hypothetical protein